MDDRIAISFIKQGNLNGLEALVTRYQVQAVHAAYMIVYDRPMAEDIVQSAFIKVAERISQFDEQRPFAPWFFRIVVNDALKAVKREIRTIPLDESLNEAASHLTEWLVDSNPTPELALEEKQIRENILQAIRSLPPEQRAVVVMRYYLEMSEADMTAKMDRPLSTIKWWLRDARKRLRQLMTPSGHKDDGSKE
jgi:RNA polymerase sigma-70 factor (ECF subfamily)